MNTSVNYSELQWVQKSDEKCLSPGLTVHEQNAPENREPGLHGQTNRALEDGKE